MKRRDFIKAGAAAGVGSLLAAPEVQSLAKSSLDKGNFNPVVVASSNGMETVKKDL